MPQVLVTCARIILLAADGRCNTAIAAQLELLKPTVGLWRQRYWRSACRDSTMRLYDELRPGGPRTIRDEQIVRHGTTTLFAALDIASGQVLAQCERRHCHQEFP
jgi:hypothetical protein